MGVVFDQAHAMKTIQLNCRTYVRNETNACKRKIYTHTPIYKANKGEKPKLEEGGGKN